MDQLKHDMVMVLVVAGLIVLIVFACIYLSFMVSQPLGSQDLHMMRQHSPVIYTPICTHDFNEGGLGWRS